MGPPCWFGAKEWKQYGSPIPANDQEAQKLVSRGGGGGRLSMAAWGLLHGLQSRHREPPASFAQPVSQCHALSQAPVRIQGLCQMLTHSFHFSSL